MKGRTPVALTIAGSDSGGGAGIQADLKTFAALGVYGACAITAITAQNTLGVSAIELVSAAMLRQQIEAVFADMNVAAVKIGMLGCAANVAVVADALSARGKGPFVVYDPVLRASSGDALAAEGLLAAVIAQLLPSADCLTPNLYEAATLLGLPEAADEAEMVQQGCALLDLGPRAVLMKGGHLKSRDAVDILVTRDHVERFAAPRIEANNLHGTGCTLSSAIAAQIVLGATLPQAVATAKHFVRDAIEAARDLKLGAGPGPLIQVANRRFLEATQLNPSSGLRPPPPRRRG